jgi:hypothetical protein
LHDQTIKQHTDEGEEIMGKHSIIGTTLEVGYDDLNEEIDVIQVGAESFYGVKLDVLEADSSSVRFGLTGREDCVMGFLVDYFIGDEDLAVLHVSIHKLFVVNPADYDPANARPYDPRHAAHCARCGAQTDELGHCVNDC